MNLKSRPTLIAIAVIAAIAGMAALSITSHSTPGKPVTQAKSSMAVEMLAPRLVNWPLTLATSGPLAAWQEAIISAETDGLRITALHVDVGTRVTRGQLLAELANDAVKAEVYKAEAAVASARAELRQAQANARRSDALRTSGSISGQQIEQYEISQQTAAAKVQSTEADLQTANIRLAHTRITAVDDGIISSRQATLGTVVSSGTKLFTLVRHERIEWRAEVDPVQLGQLKIDQHANVRLPNGTTVAGRIRQLSPTFDEKTRMGIAYIPLPNGSAAHAGGYASGTIELGERPAMILPSSAVISRDGRSYVFEVDTVHQTVIQHEVTTGRIRGDQVEISSGLKPNTPVVRSGGGFLNDGDTVHTVKGAA